MMPTPAGISEEIEKLERRYAKDPEGRFFVPLANAYRRAGDAQRAISLLRQGLERHPEYLSAHIVLGKVLAEEGEERAAEKEFEFVLSVDPQNLVALRTLGELAFRRGAADEGRQWYEKLLSVDPMNEEARRALESPVRPRSMAERTEGSAVLPVGGALEAEADDGDPGTVQEEGEGPGIHFGEEESSAVITETIAELYTRQGFHEQAAEVYRELIRRRGGDPLLEERLHRVQRLAHGLPESGAEEPDGISELAFPAGIAAGIALDPTDGAGALEPGAIEDDRVETGEADLLIWEGPAVGEGASAESARLESAGGAGLETESTPAIPAAAPQESTAQDAADPRMVRHDEGWPAEERVAPFELRGEDGSGDEDVVLTGGDSAEQGSPVPEGEGGPERSVFPAAAPLPGAESQSDAATDPEIASGPAVGYLPVDTSAQEGVSLVGGGHFANEAPLADGPLPEGWSLAQGEALADDRSLADDELSEDIESLAEEHSTPETMPLLAEGLSLTDSTGEAVDPILTADAAAARSTDDRSEPPVYDDGGFASVHLVDDGADPFAESFRFGFSPLQEEERSFAADRDPYEAQPPTKVQEWSADAGTIEQGTPAAQNIREFLGQILAWTPAPAPEHAESGARLTSPGEEMHFDSGVLAELEDLATELSVPATPRALDSDPSSEPGDVEPSEPPIMMMHPARDVPGPGVEMPAEFNADAPDTPQTDSALPEAQTSPAESASAEEERDDDLESFQAWLQSLKR